MLSESDYQNLHYNYLDNRSSLLQKSKPTFCVFSWYFDRNTLWIGAHISFPALTYAHPWVRVSVFPNEHQWGGTLWVKKLNLVSNCYLISWALKIWANAQPQNTSIKGQKWLKYSFSWKVKKLKNGQTSRNCS